MQEDREHIVLMCRRWEQQRTQYIRRIIDKANEMSPGGTQVGITHLVLGGELNKVTAWADFVWVPVSRDKLAGCSFMDDGPDEDQVWFNSGMFRVAAFLNKVSKERGRIFAEQRGLELAATEGGLAALAYRRGTFVYD